MNVIGAMLSTGFFYSVAMWQPSNIVLFTEFLRLLMIYVDKHLSAIQDNSSLEKFESNSTDVESAASKGAEAIFPYALQSKTQ